ncbi:MAG: hypothetical protein AB7K52_11815 [Phycisphaerales bacterium]
MTRRHVGFFIAIGLLIWGGIAAYRAHVRYNLFPRNFGVVDEGKIFRAGAQTPAMLKALIERHKIRTVVDLGAYEPGDRDLQQATRTLKALGVQRFEFRLVGDGTGDPNNYVRALNVITDPTKQPVLVHCATGAQRTSACIVFYRHISQRVPLEAAFAESFDFKHDPADNPRLKPYIDRWADAVAQSFRSGQPIPIDQPPPRPAGE